MTAAPPPAPPGAGDAAVLGNAGGLALATLVAYRELGELPGGGGATANPAVREHLVAGLSTLETEYGVLSEATREAGGEAPVDPDPRYRPVIEQVLPTVRGPGDVVGLALTLDDVLAQTLTRAAIDLTTPPRRGLAAGVAAGAAARKARLLVLQSLLAAGGTEFTVTPPLDALSGEVGAVGFPDVRAPFAMAAPVAAEGSR